MKPCQCTHEAASHRGYRPGREDERGCLTEGCSCLRYRAAKEGEDFRAAKPATRVKISEDDKRFAEWQVKTLLRMAHEIRVKYDLPMPE